MLLKPKDAPELSRFELGRSAHVGHNQLSQDERMMRDAARALRAGKIATPCY